MLGHLRESTAFGKNFKPILNQVTTVTQKVKKLLKKVHLFEIYRNETNITFHRNPPRLLIPSERKFFGCVFNKFCPAPMSSLSDEKYLLLRASFIGPNIWKPPQCRPL